MHKDTKEIETEKKIQYGWLAFIFILFHFIVIVQSILADPDSDHPIDTFSKQYVTPFFQQKWSMFAPCPILENRFKFKLYFDNDTSQWIDPSINTLKQHAKYRVSYHGNIAVGEYNLLFWVKADLDQQNILSDTIIDYQKSAELKQKTGTFLMRHYLRGYAQTHFNKKAKKVDLILNYYNVKNHDTLTYHILNFN